MTINNTRLTDKKRVKIADFGMACFPNEDDYYRQSDSTPVPIRWVAPESVLERLYSEKSDVVCSQFSRSLHEITWLLFCGWQL